MADDVTFQTTVATPPDGTVVATDQVGSRHVQLMGLIPGPADTATTERIGGDAANGLDVDVTRLPALPAGANNIGDVDVLTLPSLPAGANAIGKLAPNSGVDIGDVDVMSVPADPFGASADAVVAAGAAGSISAKLRRTTQGLEDLKTGIVLAAGSAAIGKLAANSGVDIGDVDVASLPPITGSVTANAGANLNTSALALDTTLVAAIIELGGLTETAPSTDTGSSGLNGRLQRIAQRLTSLIALLPSALGAGGGLKVDGSGTALPISGTVAANAGTNLNTSALALEATLGTTNTEIGGLTETAPATDTASSGLNGRLQRIAQRLSSLIALLPSALGAGGGLKVDGSGTALPVSGTVTANAGSNLNTSALALEATLGTTNTEIGGLTETAPATDTASSGLNGRLQRIAQRLTSLIALLPAALGAGGGLKVDGSGTALPVSGTVTANAGTGVHTVGLIQTRISVTPTVSTSPAYTAKDAVGGLLTFANAARVSGGTIVIQTVIVIDNSQQMPALELVLFDRTFTNSTDNAIFAPSDADLANVVGVVPISAWSDFSTNSVATRFGIGLAAKLNGTDLFGQLVTRSTQTFVATSDIVVILEILQD